MTVLETRSVLTLLRLYHVVKMSQWKLTLLFGYQNVFEASLTFPFFLFSLHSISFFFLNFPLHRSVFTAYYTDDIIVFILF